MLWSGCFPVVRPLLGPEPEPELEVDIRVCAYSGNLELSIGVDSRSLSNSVVSRGVTSIRDEGDSTRRYLRSYKVVRAILAVPCLGTFYKVNRNTRVACSWSYNLVAFLLVMLSSKIGNTRVFRRPESSVDFSGSPFVRV